MSRLLTQIDIGHHEGRTALRVWTDDGTEHVYPLEPTQAAAIVSRLAGALLVYLTDYSLDRTAETVAANPDVFKEAS